MDQVREELQQMLRAKAVPLTDLSSYPALIEYAEVELAGRLPEGADIGRFALALVSEAALRPGPVGKNDRGEPAYPLRAAKHLLALGEYPEDVHAEVPETGMSLYAIKNLDPKNPIKANDPRGPHTLGLRAQIAALASKYGESRGVLLKEGSKRLGEVVSALNGELSALLADPRIVEILQARVMPYGLPTPPNPSNADIDAVLASAVNQVDKPAGPGYPDAIRPTKLVASMTLSPVDRIRPSDSLEEAEIRLYAGRDSSGGVEALAALSRSRVIVLGDPGSGKTTILAASFSNHVQAGGTGIFVRLSDVGRLAEANPPKSAAEAARILVDAFELWLDVRMSGTVHSALQAKVLDDSDMLLALDGLDEVHSISSRLASFQTIKHVNEIRGRIAITSRHTGYTSPSPSFYEFEVDRLTWDQVEAFLLLWFPSESHPGRERVHMAMLSSMGIRDLMTIPLMACLVAFVAAREPVPRRLGELYQRYISLFFERRWKAPDMQRDVGQILDIAELVSLATEVAWKMATPEPIDQLVSNHGLKHGWSEIVTAQELAAIGQDRPAAFLELLTVDGLLTKYGTSSTDAPLLQQQYRWLHRTIHEHLVGAHLARRMGTEPEAVAAFMAAAFEGPATWEVPIQHAMDMLRPSEQDKVFEALGDAMSHEEQRIVLARAQHQLARIADPLSLERQNVLEQEIEDERWEWSSQLDFERTTAAVREHLRAKGPTRKLVQTIVRLPFLFSNADAEFCEALARALDPVGSAHQAFLAALSLMAKHRPKAAARLAVEHARRFPHKHFGYHHPIAYSISKDLAKLIRRESSTLPYPENISFAGLLDSLLDHRELTKNDFVKRPNFCVAHLMRHPRELDKPAEPFFSHVLEGVYGDEVMFGLARRTPYRILRYRALDYWAEVGFWAPLHLGRSSEVRRYREDRVLYFDNRDIDESVSRYERFSKGDLSDPTKLTNLLKSIAACSNRCLPEQMSALVDLWFRLTTPADLPNEIAPLSPKFPLFHLLPFIRAVGFQANSALVWPALQQRAAQPTARHLVTASFGFQMDGYHYAPFAERVSRVIDMCRWGTSNGVGLLEVFASNTDSIDLPTRLLAEHDVDLFCREDNTDRVATWFWRAGLLPLWSDRVLSLTK